MIAETATRLAFTPAAHEIADLVAAEILPAHPLSVPPEDEPYLANVLRSASQLGAGLGLAEAGENPEHGAITSTRAAAIHEAISTLPTMDPEHRRLAAYLLRCGHFLGREGKDRLCELT